MESTQRSFSQKELRQFNGEAGKPAYVAFKGKVYDVSNSKLWKEGKHRDRHSAGDDLTANIANAPHGDEVMMKFPVVGEFRERDTVKERLFRTVEKLHFHSMITHFSVAYTIIVPTLALLYLFTGEASFEKASYYILVFGFLANLGAGLSGLFSWKVTYEGRKNRIFVRKIVLSILLAILSVTCLIWRTADPNILIMQTYLSYFYLLLLLSLIPIVTILGHYGGKIVFPS